MSVNRRDFLKLGAAAFGTSLLGFSEIKAEDDKYANTLAMLNDCTRCVGCRGCQSACKIAHGLENTGDDPRYDMPLDMNARNLTLIQLYKKSEKEITFVKRNCLHCNEPSCVSVCPVSAFKKRSDGIVSYDKDKCIGCRYCQVACPFDAPTFEFDKTFPVIQKCDFCKDIRIKDGKPPVCAEVCPKDAITFGKRGELIKEAKRRINENPGKYNPHVYGEKEIAGTSVLYLAPINVQFADLGFRLWDETPPGELQENIQHGIFKYWIPPIALYGALGLAAYSMSKKKKRDENMPAGKAGESGEVSHES